MKTGQASSQSQTHLKLRILLIHSFWLAEKNITKQLWISVGTAPRIMYDDLTFC